MCPCPSSCILLRNHRPGSTLAPRGIPSLGRRRPATDVTLSDELPRRNRLLYASGAFGGNIIGRTKDLWLIYYYAPPEDADLPTLVPIVVVGVILAVARVIEAFDDPFIGYWSDRTRTRWGRRIPFVVLATPFYALFFVLLWSPPEGSESVSNALYLFFILEAFHLFSTLSGGPFESLLPEIAVRAKDRVNVVAWQVFFGAIGAGVGFVASGLMVDYVGFRPMAVVIAVLGLSSRYLALAGAWGRVRREQPPAELGLREAFRVTFRNDQFLYFLPTFILFNMGISLMTAALPYMVTAVLGEEEEGTLVAGLTATAIAVIVLVLPLMFTLALRRSKRWVYSTAMLVGAAYLPFLFFLGLVPGVPELAQAFFFVALIGLPMAAMQTFPNAIMADIIDYDALRTGMRREAMYYGSQATLEKIASALFPVILAGLLIVGSTSDNPLGVRLVGPVAGLSTLLGYLTFRGYWLPDSVTPETIRAARPA